MRSAHAPSAPHPAPFRGGAHLPALDGVRGLAILTVMTLHFGVPFGNPAGWLRLVHACWCGVDLFFVLSGFLITGILLDSRREAHYFRNFYARRILRIFPLYYGALACFLFLSPLRHRPPSDPFWTVYKDQAWLWLYLQNLWVYVHNQFLPAGLNHFWSLAVEEQFYLAWPLLVFLCNRRALFVVCAVFLLGPVAVRAGLLGAGFAPGQVYVFTLGRLDGFAAGAVVALLLRGNLDPARLKGGARAVCLGCGLVLTMLFLRRPEFMQWGDPLTLAVGLTLLAVLFGGVVALAATARPGGLAGRLFGFGPLRFLGKYSYGIYVYHFLIFQYGWQRLCAWAQTSYLPSFLRFPLGKFCFVPIMLTGMALAVTAAVLSWHLYEKHFLKLKRFFPQAGSVPPPTAVPGAARRAA